MTLLCVLCAVVAFLLFGLSTDNHHRQRIGFKTDARRKRALRAGAWLAVALCLPLAFAAQGPVFGPILWLGALMSGAGVVFLFLNLVPAADAIVRPKSENSRRS